MEWLLVLLVVTETSAHMSSQSHYMVQFKSEQQCMEAVDAFTKGLSGTSEHGAKTTVKGVCAPRR